MNRDGFPFNQSFKTAARKSVRFARRSFSEGGKKQSGERVELRANLSLRLQNKAGRRQNFQVPRKTAKMWIENPKTIVTNAEENYFSRPEHSSP
jgi:hypothetical protein